MRTLTLTLEIPHYAAVALSASASGARRDPVLKGGGPIQRTGSLLAG